MKTIVSVILFLPPSQNLQSTPPKLVSDYDIVKLVLSDRKLDRSDVALYSVDAQIPRFVYTNGQFFRVQSTNAMVLLTAERQP